MVLQFSCQGNTTVINFSVVHQTSSQTLSLPPRRQVEVYLWGYNQLIQPLAHLLVVMLCCTLGLQVGACSCSCCRGRSCTIQKAASGFVIGEQIKCLWLCLGTSNTATKCGQSWQCPQLQCSGTAVWMDWGSFGTEKSAAYKSCNAFSALLCGHQPSCVGPAAST